MADLIQTITLDKVIERVDTEIEQGNRLSINELAIWSGYSHRHLQRLFMAYTGIPLGEYIRRRRLNRAALLLRYSQHPIQDIAVSVGFDSLQSMYRYFKKRTGFTPKQYRHSQDWYLSPLTGSRRSFFDIPEPERLYLPGGDIVGDEFCARGCITHASISPSMRSLLASIFNRKLEKLWMVVRAEPIKHRKYHYQVTGCKGIPKNTPGMRFTYPSGNYAKVEFETTLDSHIARINHIYQNILSRKGAVRAPGPEVIVFRHEGGRFFCTLFIPVK